MSRMLTRSATSARGSKVRTTPASRPAKKAIVESRAKVRMYRHGLGDCFLLTLPTRGKAGGGSYFILIDCGVILGTPDASTKMTRVVEDVVATTGGKIDLLIATHEHWDHLSGFIQAADAFKKLKVGQVWMAWTEDPHDHFAQQLGRERDAALTALRLSVTRLHLGGNSETASEIGGLLEFFGAAAGNSTKDAIEIVRKMAPKPRYCRPEDDPVDIAGTGARLYVLGPPRDQNLINKTTPSKRDPETYGMALQMFLDQVGPSLAEPVPESPFGPMFAIPDTVAQEMNFFKNWYWQDGAAAEAWRRIDTAWLDGASELALQLDSKTNNTSLVVALELAEGDVLLFAADAQVGNWLSWQNLKWSVDGRTITGPDLLRRTIFYKVGHHGSHNATLRERGLEMMDKLQVAMIPVDHAMAVKKRWGNMPLPELVQALNKKAHGAVFRTDEAAPNVKQKVTSTDLYFEIAL